MERGEKGMLCFWVFILQTTCGCVWRDQRENESFVTVLFVCVVQVVIVAEHPRDP